MLRPIRITLVVLFVLLLLGAGGLYYYNYTHEDVSRPAFTVDEERLEVSVNDPREAFTRGLRAFDNVDGEITDRINVTIAPNDQVAAALEGFADYIKTQVLADSIVLAENNGVETEFDDFKLNIQIDKN